MKTDIVIIGGGASGFAAAMAAKETAPELSVLIAEKLPRTGKKLIATGNGKCNLSNMSLASRNFHGSIDAMSIIGRTPDWRELFTEKLGVACVTGSEGREGGVYPRSNSSTTVLNAIRLRLSALGVTEQCECEITDIKPTNGGFTLTYSGGEISCRKVIIAAGGYAAPSFGTDGGMLRILRNMGIKSEKICPAVAPLRVSPERLKGLKGVRVKGEIAAFSGGRELRRERGELQFNENNISGICVFNLAYLFQQYEGRLTLRADLAPDMTAEELAAYFRRVRADRRGNTAEELLSGFFVKNLAVWLIKNILGRSPAEPIESVSDRDIAALCSGIKSVEFEVTGCSPWQNAQSTMGGISADSVTDKLDCVKYGGMYLCGEILDVAGDCGGYNLQWAWSSGTWAGKNAALSLKGGKYD
ncbi:MAG: aminoacetone oxidase family FAD-binding enzyme [Ruminococcus sp.]|nr:aminoacetone oxidase family FAD-binding enzyme [Ruminococcus sp.]